MVLEHKHALYVCMRAYESVCVAGDEISALCMGCCILLLSIVLQKLHTNFRGM